MWQELGSSSGESVGGQGAFRLETPTCHNLEVFALSGSDCTEELQLPSGKG